MGFSSDGDPKLLSAMVYEASLTSEISHSVTQDSIHIGTKGRNRLLKPNIILPMGTFRVSIDHLKQLLRSVPKHIHGLSYIDVFPTDRMNYTSFEKITQDRVINALKNNVPDSDATVQYLRTFRSIVHSFTKHDLKPLDRVMLLWQSVFFLRIWRKFIKSSHRYNLKDNFITYNTYMCAEINAKYLIRIMKLFRDRDLPEMFLPPIFDSQACESTFRQFRSMGTTQYTKINFSLLELIHSIGRIEVQNYIAYCKLNIDGVEFPNKRKDKTTIYQLPTNEEIHSTIDCAKLKAFQISQKLGITSANLIDEIEMEINEFNFESKLQLNCDDEDHDEGLFDDMDENAHSECDQDLDVLTAQAMYEANFLDQDEFIDEYDPEPCTETSPLLSPHLEKINENSPLVYVNDEYGRKKLLRKSAFLWMITEPAKKSSNDRLKRFQIK